MSVYIEIYDAIIKVLKSAFPDINVFTDNVLKTEYSDQTMQINNYFYIDLIPVNGTTTSKYHTRYNILVDIAGFFDSKCKKDYLQMADKIDKVIRPVLHFGDRAITVHDWSFTIVDDILHYNFTLSFIDSLEEKTDESFMEELITTQKGRELWDYLV